MPVVATDYEDLVSLIGKRIPREELVARVPMMGGAYEGEDERKRLLFEFFPNRPDLLSVEGLARACRAYFDVKPGLARIPVAPSGDHVDVEPSVAKIRPVIGFARVEGLRLDDERLAQLIELQERLTVGPGRKRRKVAIGIHDAAPVKGPFTYKAVRRDEVRFVPLGHKEPMTPAEIFERHEKGRIYAPLLDGFDRVPLIVDHDGNVLSLPPVINGELTALTTRTKDVLVDVTGTDERAVMGLLAIVVYALADRGGKVLSLEIRSGKSTGTTPDLAPASMALPLRRVRDLLGLDLTPPEAAAQLARLGHEASPDGAQKLRVESPAYRTDLLHPDDLVEDVGIGYGFDRFQGRLPQQALFGGVLASTKTRRRARTVLLGLGFTEVVTLTITGKPDQFQRFGAPDERAVEIANPLTQDQAILRVRLVPSLLGLLRANKHRDLPQSIFEIGDIAERQGAGAPVRLHAAALRISSDAGFSECKGLVEAFLRDSGLKAEIEPAEPPGYIPGRAAQLRDDAGVVIGHFGEVRPETVTAFELSAPVIGFEIKL